MKKYCIAFVPQHCDEDLIIFSQKISSLDKKYELGEKSIPHITVCQFYSEENKVDDIWEEITDRIHIKELCFSLNTFSCITFDEKIFWISLIPFEIYELYKIQKDISTILNISTTREYEPHLTLVGTTDSAYREKARHLMKEYKTLSDDFVLSIGACDELGQLISIIHQSEGLGGESFDNSAY